MESKECIKCNKSKTIDNFSIVKSKNTLSGSCKDCVKEYKLQYRLNNLDKAKLYHQKSYEKVKGYSNNREFLDITNKICSKCLEIKEISNFSISKNSKSGFVNKCKDCSKKYMVEYHKNNNDKRLEYLAINNDIIQSKRRVYRKTIVRSDISILKERIRCGIINSFRLKGYTKKYKTEHILGCSFLEFKLYLESKFEDWMTWDNRGNPKDGILEFNKTWDIDHKIPLVTAKTEEEVIKLNHYTNLQPLCSYTNRIIKNDSIL
jgi:hypothetical protein